MKDLLAEGTRIRHFGPLRNACEAEYMVAARNLPSHLNLLEANGYCVSVAPNANPTTLVLLLRFCDSAASTEVGRCSRAFGSTLVHVLDSSRRNATNKRAPGTSRKRRERIVNEFFTHFQTGRRWAWVVHKNNRPVVPRWT